jgi:hypothetical protein
MISFYIKLVGVYLCSFNMANRADYSRVISWSISLESSESATWLGLEHVLRRPLHASFIPVLDSGR